MMNRWRKRIPALVLIGSVLPAVAAAQAQPACNDVRLNDANRLYDLGFFEEVADTLKTCLPGRIRPGVPRFRRRSQATQALRLMALSSYARREPADSTEQWIKKLVTLDRRYRADPEEDPLFFQTLVDDLRPRRFYQKRWVQVGGALVVGGLIGCVVAGCFEKTIAPLPGPPSDPPRGGN